LTAKLQNIDESRNNPLLNFSDELLSNLLFILKIVIGILEKNRGVSEKQHPSFEKISPYKTAVYSGENSSSFGGKLEFHAEKTAVSSSYKIYKPEGFS